MQSLHTALLSGGSCYIVFSLGPVADITRNTKQILLNALLGLVYLSHSQKCLAINFSHLLYCCCCFVFSIVLGICKTMALVL